MDSGNFSRNRSFLLSVVVVFMLTFMPVKCEHHQREFSSNETNHEIINGFPVKLFEGPNTVTLDNRLVSVTLSKPGGMVTKIRYNAIRNILATSDPNRANSGYWDCNWNSATGHAQGDKSLGTEFKVISKTRDQVEISFIKKANKGSQFPLNVERRYIMRRGSSGFYTYGIYEHLQGWPWVNIHQLRIVYKLNENQFRYLAISDKRQKIMPTGTERSKGNTLSIKEAVRLRSGEVDDKYQYSSDNKDNHLHGWIADDMKIGFWMITPSDEFRVGGPFRQDLTSHAGATTLSMFVSSHYAGPSASSINIKNGEPWKKVYGPVFVHLNTDKTKDHRGALWAKAKEQMNYEKKNWPYSFPLSADYMKPNQRGTVFGELLVLDRYVNKNPRPAAFAHVGLALPGSPGSWETENKGYQFWTRADKVGHFIIKGVRPGTYNMYAWVPGVLGDYRYKELITIKKGGQVVKLNGLVFEPLRFGPTLWDIGHPDRTAAEFYIPDVNPNYVNKLYTSFDKFRQYALWDRYSDLHQGDLTFTIGSSNYSRDWFYAHNPRRGRDGKFSTSTWNIVFNLGTVAKNKDYTLRFGIAAASGGRLRISVNNGSPFYTIGPLGKDNAIARHGIHGLYHLGDVKIRSTKLVKGKNIIHLSMANDNPLEGFMYDYIRLEGPLA